MKQFIGCKPQGVDLDEFANHHVDSFYRYASLVLILRFPVPNKMLDVNRHISTTDSI